MLAVLKYWRILVFVGAAAGGGWAGYKVAQSGCLGDKLDAAENYAAALEQALSDSEERYQAALDEYAARVRVLMAQQALDAAALAERDRRLAEARERLNEIRRNIVAAELGVCSVTPDFARLWRRIISEANNAILSGDSGGAGSGEAGVEEHDPDTGPAG